MENELQKEIENYAQNVIFMEHKVDDLERKKDEIESNRLLRVKQLLDCKDILGETATLYLECLVPNIKTNNSIYADGGSLLKEKG